MRTQNKFGGGSIEIERGCIHPGSHPKNAAISLSMCICVSLCLTIFVARSQLNVNTVHLFLLHNKRSHASTLIQTQYSLSCRHTDIISNRKTVSNHWHKNKITCEYLHFLCLFCFTPPVIVCWLKATTVQQTVLSHFWALISVLSVLTLCFSDPATQQRKSTLRCQASELLRG